MCVPARPQSKTINKTGKAKELAVSFVAIRQRLWYSYGVPRTTYEPKDAVRLQLGLEPPPPPPAMLGSLADHPPLARTLLMSFVFFVVFQTHDDSVESLDDGWGHANSLHTVPVRGDGMAPPQGLKVSRHVIVSDWRLGYGPATRRAAIIHDQCPRR